MSEPSVICERTYQMVLDGETKAVPVRWFQPQADRSDWNCQYEIVWPHQARRRRAVVGIDSVQALLLAMQSVAGELYDAEPPVFLYEPDDVLDLPPFESVAHLEAARTKGR